MHDPFITIHVVCQSTAMQRVLSRGHDQIHPAETTARGNKMARFQHFPTLNSDINCIRGSTFHSPFPNDSVSEPETNQKR